MFQYAFGIAAGNVLWDTTSFAINTYRTFDLGLYNINKTYATEAQIKKCLNEIRFKSPWPRFLRKKFGWRRHIYLKSNRVLEKQINRYEPDIFKEDGDVYYDGLFQTEKYFKPFREKLLHDFTLSVPFDEANTEMLRQIKTANSVAIHIRRGDYLNPKVPLVLLGTDYYLRAINYIAAHIDNPHFFIFSNDAAWARENITIPYPITIVDINDEKHGYFDLELMRCCKHDIIANSSFSWWGAWLNTNPEKTVIAPNQWFKPDAAEYSGDIVSEDWIKL